METVAGPTLAQPNTVFVVASYGDGPPGFLFDGRAGVPNSSRHVLYYRNVDPFQATLYAGGDTISSEVIARIPRVWTGAFNAPGSELRMDGRSLLSNGTHTSSWEILELSDAGQPLNGWIGELLVYDSLLTPQEIADTEDYLAKKWGLWTEPPVTAGLEAHYQATYGVGLDTDGVHTWRDLSGNGHDLTQATGSNKPALIPNQQNNLPVVQFDGIDDFINNPFVLDLIPQPFTVISALKSVNPTPPPAGEFMVSDGFSAHDNDANNYALLQGSAQIRFASPNPGLAEPEVLTGVFNGSSSYMRQDGDTGSFVTASSNMHQVVIGARNNGTFPWPGNFFEHVVYNRELTTQEIESVEAYLTAKWNPFPITAGLKAHFDATAGAQEDVDGVHTWYDLSGNGNHLTQATGAAKPALVKVAQNGLPGVLFDGVDDVMVAASISEVQPLTHFSVFKMDAFAERNISDGVGFAHAISHHSLSGLRIAAGVSLYSNPNTLEPADPLILSAVFNGASSKIRINGGSENTGDAGASSPTDGITLGANRSGSRYLSGFIFEHVVFNRELTAQEIEAVEAHLAAKWGITVGSTPPPVTLNLTHHWDAAIGITADVDGVATWAQTGHGSSVSALEQLTGSLKPDVISDGIGAGVAFDGIDDTMFDDSGSQTDFLGLCPNQSAKDGTLFMVMDGTSAPVSDNAYSLGNTSTGGNCSSSLSFATASRLRFDSRGTTRTRCQMDGIDSTLPQVLVCRNDNVNALLRRNGDTGQVQVAVVDLNPAVVTKQAFQLNQTLLGNVREILYYDRALSVAEVDQVEAYLGTKWGITIT
jgi:hypothetical protein